MINSLTVKRGLLMISKNHKKYLTILLVNILILLFISGIGSADSILARDNKKELKLSGKIIELRNGKVSILGEDGTITNVNWNNIGSITIGDQVFVTLATEERVFGSLKLENGQVIINSASMGKIKSDQSKIVAIERRKQEVSPALAISPQKMAAKTEAEWPAASHQKPLGKNQAKAGPGQQPSPPKSKEVVAQPLSSPAPFSEIPPASDKLMAAIRGKGGQSAPSAEGTKEEKKEEGKKETEKTTEAGKKPTTIGEKGEKRVEETFVRAEKVVLPKGKLDTELNVSYFDNSHVGFLGVRDRALVFPFTLRYGITNRLLGLVTVPVGIGWREIPGETKTRINQTAGLRDISFGLQYQVLTEGVVRPDVALFLLASSDTGKGGFLLPSTQTPLGTGFWQINPGVSFVKTVDPVVLFGSLSYSHFFEKTGFQPGEAINPVLGTGFAINDEIAISFKLAGSFITRPRFHGDDFGSVFTPFSFYFTVDKYITNNSYLEPSVGIGLTNDAPNFSFGLTYVYRWF